MNQPIPQYPEHGKGPKLWRFKKYTEVQVEKHRAKEVFGEALGEMLSKGQAVVLIPVDNIQEVIDAEFEVVKDGDDKAGG